MSSIKYKKRIGTLTFHRSLNYGSVLQTYALQQIIKRINTTEMTEIIDFYPPAIDKIRSPFIPVHTFKNFVHNVFSILYYPLFGKRRKAFDDFLTKNVIISETKYDVSSDMSCLEEKYDCVIAGSDQIWNNQTQDFSIQYFFPSVVNVKKIAYAPSIGNGKFELPRDYKVFEALNKFSALSVRELSGAEHLGLFLKNSKLIPVLLDPTLLLTKEDYQCLENPRRMRSKYIFLYSVNMDKRTLEIANEISKKLKLPIVTIYTTNASFRTFYYGIKLSGKSGPGDFLSFIHHAELVISDSFHGSAFAINYEKKFYSICEKDEKKRDARLETLLSTLQLKNRMLFFDDYNRFNYMEEIDYSQIEVRLKNLKEESLDYLERELR